MRISASQRVRVQVQRIFDVDPLNMICFELRSNWCTTSTRQFNNTARPHYRKLPNKDQVADLHYVAVHPAIFKCSWAALLSVSHHTAVQALCFREERGILPGTLPVKICSQTFKLIENLSKRVTLAMLEQSEGSSVPCKQTPTCTAISCK